MAQQILNPNSTQPNDKLGDSPWNYTSKVNSNFTELYGLIGGANNTVIINSIDDFPAPVGNVITLEDNKVYFIGTQIVTDKQFECAQNNIFTSGNPFWPALIYTGTGTMFSGYNVSFALDRIVVSCPNAPAFSFGADAGQSPTFGLNLAAVAECQKAGTFNNLRSINITNSSFFSCSAGITIQGTDNWSALSVLRLRVESTLRITGIDLTTSTHESFELSDYIIVGTAGSVGINGLVNNGNIKPNFIGSIQRCEFTAGVTPLSGITTDDIRYSFIGNSGVQDSTVDANPYLTTATTVTVNTAGVYEKINQSNWSFSEASRLSVSTDGDVTNELEQPIKVQINGSITLEKVGGGADLLTARLVYNDLPNDPQSAVTTLGTDNTNPTNIGLVGIFNLNPGDSVSIYVANNNSTSNVVVNYANFALLRVL